MFTHKIVIVGLFALVSANAEEHVLTIQQALALASRQNPDITLARLDQQRAQQGVRIAQDPFRPKTFAGSGLAYTYGYPNPINGNAPSLFQLNTDMALYNRPDSYRLAAARESARGSAFQVQNKADEVAYQTADLFLTANQLAHETDTLAGQLPSLQKVVDVMSAAVEGGSELPVEVKRAKLNLAATSGKLESAKLDLDYYASMLAVALGYPASDRVKPIDSDLPVADPGSQQTITDTALRNNRELRQMQSNVLAKELEYRSYRSARLPQVGLVAQYALFAKYNYQQYFQKFQANNFQLGASITIPILVGSAANGSAEQAATDLRKMRIQMEEVRNRIVTDTQRNYQQWQKAVSQRDVARMQLDVARDDLTVLLAQNQEGRAPMKTLEQARLDESQRWIELYESEAQVTRTKLALLRQEGNLMAAIGVTPTETSHP